MAAPPVELIFENRKYRVAGMGKSVNMGSTLGHLQEALGKKAPGDKRAESMDYDFVLFLPCAK